MAANAQELPQQYDGTLQSSGLPADPGHEVYREALLCLLKAKVPFLVGGALALESYTGRARRTKDLDLFVNPADRIRLMQRLSDAGFRTEWRFPHWLGKAYKEDRSIDIIYSSGNGVCPVDEAWFRYALPAEVLGIPVKVVPAEEMLWSKAFVMERNRYDGGDIAHLLRARAHSMDWARLLFRFGTNWRVLFSHVLLFGFIYPEQRLRIPDWFMHEMMRRMKLEMQCLPADRDVCQGTLLSWSQYLADLDRGEYQDARLSPRGRLTLEDTQHMTAVLQEEQEGQEQ
ncbi:MAG TPA: hypothetical protein VF127_01990 [Nitrospira sp.]